MIILLGKLRLEVQVSSRLELIISRLNRPLVVGYPLPQPTHDDHHDHGTTPGGRDSQGPVRLDAGELGVAGSRDVAWGPGQEAI